MRGFPSFIFFSFVQFFVVCFFVSLLYAIISLILNPWGGGVPIIFL